MELLHYLLPNPHLLHLNSYELLPNEHQLTLSLTSTQTQATCPICGQRSHRVHSRYERRLADLPCVGFSLTLIVKVCKFFCSNPNCHRRIFTERLPEVAAPWARKTIRFVQQLQSIGLALGGAAGARLGAHLGIAICGSTLLGQIAKLKLPEFKTPKALGVDDFAFRKGHHYGTILVDLETHAPIALLADRKADTLVEWLETHPGIEVFSRDRSKTYKSAMDKAAPAAIQVADRFHLVKNLGETIATALGDYGPELRAADKAQRQALVDEHDEAIVVIAPKPTPEPDVRPPESARAVQQHRIEQQKVIKALSAERWPQAAIAQEVGVSMRTVQRFLAAPDFLPKPPQQIASNRSILAPYKQQILDWWNDKVREPKVLLALLRPLGYKGSIRTVQRYVARLRAAQGLPPIKRPITHPLPKVIDPQMPPLTPRRAAYLAVLKPENREPDDTTLLEKLRHQHPDIEQLFELADDFLQLLRERKANAFDAWLLKALACKLKPLQKFAQGLLDDYDAVKVSMVSKFSNGPVEGLNNKLKMLKRQMYGRASLKLLEKRFVMAA